MALFTLGLFLGIVFTILFFWIRLSNRMSLAEWRKLLLAAALVCLFFVICFALGVWFSIARLKGEGWILSA
ncbi:MAG: hypothetical protein IPJ84_05995 [Bdellovibrionales bacterium]|nr:hypothetical protein [Bdellovibrionales bacterium]